MLELVMAVAEEEDDEDEPAAEDDISKMEETRWGEGERVKWRER